MDTKMTLNEEFARIIKQSGSHQNEYTKADSIISLMLAKVDKALLKDEQIKLELTKYAHEIMSSNPIRDWNQTELIKIVAKAQLQAIKSILKGK